MMGQGANSASYSAWTLGEAIVADHVYDERFCRRAAREREGLVLGVSDWTNIMLNPPPHVLEFIGAMSQDKALCDEFASNFNDPEKQVDVLATPERTRAYLARWAARRNARHRLSPPSAQPDEGDNRRAGAISGGGAPARRSGTRTRRGPRWPSGRARRLAMTAPAMLPASSGSGSGAGLRGGGGGGGTAPARGPGPAPASSAASAWAASAAVAPASCGADGASAAGISAVVASSSAGPPSSIAARLDENWSMSLPETSWMIPRPIDAALPLSATSDVMSPCVPRPPA